MTLKFIRPLLYVAAVASFAPLASAQKNRAANVFVETVEARKFSTRIEALGNLEPKEEVDLTLNDAGQIQKINFDDGQRVKAKQTLISLVQNEQKALVEAEMANVSEAQQQMERVNRLIIKKAVSQSEVDEAQRNLDNAKAQLRAVQSRQKDRVLYAPFSGVVGFRQVSIGAYVQPGDVVAHLVDDSEMKLEFSVPSTFLRHIKRNMPITASTDDYPGETFSGVVTSINNAVDPVTRTVSVRANIPNSDQKLLSGMFMEVSLLAAPRTVIAIKEEATQSVGPRDFVYVIESRDGQLVSKKVEVDLGIHQDGYVEVISGLKAGLDIVSEGVLQVRDGGSVKIQSPSILSSNRSVSPSGGSVDTLISRD